MRKGIAMGMSSWLGIVALFVLTLSGGAFAAPQAVKTGAMAAATGPIDLNTATQAELEKLPGVGPAMAKKIMAGRPYASTSELSTKAGLPAKTVEKIAPLVTVGTGARGAAKPSLPPPSTVKTPTAPKPPVPAGVSVPSPGKGMVWVNPDSKVYHREGSHWYGKTRKGSYMTESEAIKAGYRPAKQGGREQ